ncbi:methyltransferase domain-containing protein [Apiospora kogelbergensis]|uniref:Methyltransferase domain-containing protein n=1 Tax=Apiospora kogelbergensis TaxID=1337665 RepID=A0AAW0Q9P2_9PEZI
MFGASNLAPERFPSHHTPECFQDGATSDGDRSRGRQSVGSFTSGDGIHSQHTSILMPVKVPRESTGPTIVEPDSVFDDSGRFFHGYKKGKHVLPNVVSYASPTAADWSQGGWYRYQLPQAEQDRIDLQHAMLMMVTGGKLAHAPLNHVPEYVMNVATGTRTWPIQFGTYRPDRRHILSSSWVQANKHPKQKESSRTIVNWIGRCSPGAPRAQNCEFLMDDAEGEWLYRTLQTGVKMLLDYVHLRMVFTCFADNQAVMRDAFDSI